MTMFPMPMPEMPQEIIDMVGANPEGFADAMGSGMEAMTAAMEGGASPADAFEAMGDTMGPMMEEMGMSPDMFDAMGDMMGAAIGPAMHMAPADATGGDMGAMMQDGLDMMMPPGTDVPGPIMDAMGDMGAAMGDAGMGCHDVATEFMAPPGDDMYPLPMDGQGNPVVEPGDPSTCPADACQPPPMDGACAQAEDMMPPEGGYDHAPMNDDFVMPEPFDFATATNVSQGLNPDGTSPDALGDQNNPDPMQADLDDGGAAALGGAVNVPPAPHEEGFVGDDGGAAALGGALNVPPAPHEEGFVGNDPSADNMDAALGNAMDGIMEQGGGNVAGDVADFDGIDPNPGVDTNEPDDVDPSAGAG
jgi:hypothetical protein